MGRKALISFIISFVLLITVVIIDKMSFNSMREYTISVDHTREVITSLEELSNHFKSAEIYSEHYAPVGEQQFFGLFKQEGLEVRKEVADVQRLVNDNPEQKQRVDAIAGIINDQFDTIMIYNISELINKGQGWRLMQLFRLHDMINNAIEHENKLLEGRKKELLEFTKMNKVLSTLFSFIAIALILITFFSHLASSRKRLWLEGFLQSVLNTSKNGIISYKPISENGRITDFKIEFANKPIKELLGVNPEDVVGKRLSEFSSYVGEAGLLDRFIQVEETGIHDEFESHYATDGKDSWLFISLAKRQDGLTATFHDITKIKQYEEELKKNIVQLQHSNSELEQYAYAASHDLQEPLRKIRIFASQLKDTSSAHLDEKGIFFLDKIMSSAARMSNLIRDILGFSSLKKEHGFTTTKLEEIVNQCLQDLEMAIAQKNARVIVDPLPEIEAISLQMNQLFYNLVNNALKFSRPDVPPVIKIHSERLQAQDVMQYKTLNTKLEYCEITVSDNGIGFDNVFASQIFGLFKRLGNKQAYSGSGIGLALCRKVVENHNGIIFAHSHEGEGATFHIILPLKQAAGTAGL
jgi:PAS domain S-box-containing protein